MIEKINIGEWKGVMVRRNPKYNYLAIWNNLTTVRFDVGETMELPPDFPEFVDCGINTLCNACCPFCYVSATVSGENYEDICETWKKWMATFPEDKEHGNVCETYRPFQIAIGSTGEPTMHPDFCEFIKTVYESGVVPNYTTNGVILSAWNKPDDKDYERANEILKYTAKYCGGVAVSFGNKALREQARDAITGLFLKGNVHVMIHHLISDKNSVDDFTDEWDFYGDGIRNHVLLPLMPSGRSGKGVDEGVFEYLEEVIKKRNITNVAFGAHFIDNLEKSEKIKTWHYPAETYSKNVLLKKDRVEITPSSFDLEPIKIVEL